MGRFLVVCDVDSTLIEDEVIELLADAAGVRAEVALITERAMRGEMDFAQSLRDRVATLRGLPAGIVNDVRRAVTVTNGARSLIDAVHAAGGHIIAVSGGFHEVLDPLAKALGLDGWTANRLETEDGVLTGRTSGPIIDATAKADTLRDYCAMHDIPLGATIAVGDGANDLEMMSIAAVSVAFCAKPTVVDRADVVITERNLALVAALFGRLP